MSCFPMNKHAQKFPTVLPSCHPTRMWSTSRLPLSLGTAVVVEAEKIRWKERVVSPRLAGFDIPKTRCSI